MSTEGGGAIIAAPVLLVAGAAVLVAGGVMLAAQGVAWCGEKLQENYKAAVDSWAQAPEAARLAAEQSAQSQAAFVSMAMQRLGAQQMRAGPVGGNGRQSDADLQAAMQGIRAQAARDAQAAANDPQLARAFEEAARLALPRIQLEARIEAAKQAGLPAAVIAQATSALQGDAAAIVRVNTALDAAWAQITVTDTLLIGKRQEATGLLIQAQTQIDAVRALAQTGQGQSPTLTAQLQRLDALAREVDIARRRLAADPNLALENARELLPEVMNQAQAIIRTNATSQSAALMRRSRTQAKLKALATLADEAAQTHTLVAAVAEDYAQKATRLSQLVASSDGATLAALDAQADDLKNTLFAAINTRQQHAVADVIAATLAEEGFGADTGASQAPTVVEVDEGVYRVTGLRNDAPVGQGHDDKLVTFTLLANGQIGYDFSGYVGAACQKDAQKIFEALRRKGIVLVNPGWLNEKNLSTLSAQDLSAAPLPAFDVNKRQAQVVEGVRQALTDMQYDIHETSVGGVVQLDGRKGDLGYYHVALDAFDDVTVTLDDQDITANTGDKVVAAATRSVTTTTSERQRAQEETGYVAPQQSVSH